jgi:hypothetical protein
MGEYPEKRVVLLTGCTGTFGPKFVELYADRYSIVSLARTPPRGRVDTYDYFQTDPPMDEVSMTGSN